MDFRIYSLHGTFAAEPSQRGNRWWQKGSPFSEAVLSYLDTDTYRIIWDPFRWSGENKSSERGKAAIALSQVLSKVNHRTNKVVLLAHSHGGNVAYSARGIANRKSKTPEIPVVTVGTPFIKESYSSLWLIEDLPKYWWAFTLVFITCIAGLWFSKEGTSYSKFLAYTSMVAIGVLVISLYLKAVFAFSSQISTKRGWVKFMLIFMTKLDKNIRRKNIKDPKIYSTNDEAINSLRAVPSQQINLASKEIAFFPATFLVTVMVLIIMLLVLPKIRMIFPGDIVNDFTFIFNYINPELVSWINYIAMFIILLALATVIGFLLSQLFLARWTAKIINKLFERSLKERAYGRDTVVSRAAPMNASANLPLMIQSYGVNEKWNPIHRILEDDLEEITVKSVTDMFRAIRETLGMGLTTGSYTISETISTNFRGDELVHSAYFNHPDLPGFIAWILCEFYGFPKGTEYSTLPIDKFQEWWDTIRPGLWPQFTEQNATADEQ